MFIVAENVSVKLQQTVLLNEISCSIENGERWAIIGMNGAGKTTFLRCIARLQMCSGGRILVNGRKIQSYHPRELAKQIAYVPQAHGTVIPYRVFDYVLMGRFSYYGVLAIPAREDRRIAYKALEMTDTIELADRSMETLSGGELQRVLLAGAVSQQARALVLDEPATHLDPLHQVRVKNTLARIHAETNCTIISVTHDVNSALNDYSHVLAIKQGTILFCGTSGDIRQQPEPVLKRIFNIGFECMRSSLSSRTVYFPGDVS